MDWLIDYQFISKKCENISVVLINKYNVPFAFIWMPPEKLQRAYQSRQPAEKWPPFCLGLNALTELALFHWPAMPWRSYGVRENQQIRNKIAEMVWWNISSATISHVLRINCVSMAHGWRTCGAYGVWMAMQLRMMSRMRTWPLRIHSASGVCTPYIPRTRGGQRDSIAYGGRMYSAWVAYMPNL